MPRPLALALVPLLLLAAALGGCTPSTRLPPPEPSAAGEPLFASDEEALAAATAAYEEYLAVSNAVFRQPPRDLRPLEGVATSEFIENEEPFAEQLDENGWSISGLSTLIGVELQQIFDGPSDSAVLVVYVCLDVSGARVFDAAGVDVTPADRADEVTLEVEMIATSADVLLVNRSELWANSITCSA